MTIGRMTSGFGLISLFCTTIPNSCRVIQEYDWPLLLQFPLIWIYCFRSRRKKGLGWVSNVESNRSGSPKEAKEHIFIRHWISYSQQAPMYYIILSPHSSPRQNKKLPHTTFNQKVCRSKASQNPPDKYNETDLTKNTSEVSPVCKKANPNIWTQNRNTHT